MCRRTANESLSVENRSQQDSLQSDIIRELRYNISHANVTASATIASVARW
jgi:hypothetical protein